MTSSHETALNALLARLQTVPGATVERNAPLPVDEPETGLIIIRDGEAGEPEVTLGGVIWEWERVARVELIAPADPVAAVRDAAVDALASAIGAAIAGDPTLGDAVDYAEPGAAATELIVSEGTEPMKGAIIDVLLIYTSTGPLQ